MQFFSYDTPLQTGNIFDTNPRFAGTAFNLNPRKMKNIYNQKPVPSFTPQVPEPTQEIKQKPQYNPFTYPALFDREIRRPGSVNPEAGFPYGGGIL
jgi:hypothetical protein